MALRVLGPSQDMWEISCIAPHLLQSLAHQVPEPCPKRGLAAPNGPAISGSTMGGEAAPTTSALRAHPGSVEHHTPALNWVKF